LLPKLSRINLHVSSSDETWHFILCQAWPSLTYVHT
jgi:hypothetical protein